MLLTGLSSLMDVIRTQLFTTMHLLSILRILSYILLASTAADAATFYISPTGSDSQDGSITNPFKTLDRALQAARLVSAESKDIIFRDGNYSFNQAQEITAADSGTATHPLIIRAENEGQAILSAGITLSGLSWTSHSGGIMQTTIPAGLDLNAIAGDGLWVSGTKARLARYPNYDANAKYYKGTAADALSAARVATWADPTGGFIHALHHAEWGGNHWRITGKSNNTTVTYEGGWMNNRGGNIHATYRMVENIFEELDAENEWFLDKDTRTLYFYPPAGINPTTSEFVLASQDELIRLVGTDSSTPVKHVQIRGLQFSHTARTFMQTNEPLLRSDWMIHRSGAVYFRFAEDCQVEDCELTELGGNAIFIDGYNRRLTCSGNHIHKIGAGAYNAVGKTTAVWNPMYDPYGTPTSWPLINKADKGPKTNDYPADITFTDSLIHDIGTVEKQVAGVQISVAHKVTASKLSIYRVPRAGINISEGAFGGHLIDRCDVFDTVQETGDHGSFNSWGRDRYWSTDYGTIDSRIAADPTVPSQLPLLDMLDPITIQNSRWRCDHGWDIDLDDGSSWYIIKNNVCLGGGIKLREGFYRTVENNITVANTFHPHVWFQQSLDIVRKNIWASRYADILVNYWGQEIDLNYFYYSAGLSYSQARGLDTSGTSGDPLYLSPSTLDYTVGDSSLTTLGFVNFPMHEFGVEKASLKTLAEVPDAPDTNIVPDPIHTSYTLLGATVKSVSTLGEVSATGLPEMNGTLFLNVPNGGDVTRMGLQTLDVIREVDGVRTDTIEDFIFAWARATVTNGSVTAKLWRTQAEQTISLPPFPGMRLRAATSTIAGTTPSPVYDGAEDYLGAWTHTGAYLEWPATNITKPDSYLVLIEQAIPSSDASTYQIEGLSLTPHVVSTTDTGGWETFSKLVVGQLPINQAGSRNVVLRPLTLSSAGGVMNIREMVIIPSAVDLDTDQDGVADAMELALGSDPNLSSSLPSPEMSATIQGNTPGFSLIRPVSQTSGLSYIFEWSNDLLTWTDDTSTLAMPTVTPLDSIWERVDVDSMFDLHQESRQFFRLRIEQQHININSP